MGASVGASLGASVGASDGCSLGVPTTSLRVGNEIERLGEGNAGTEAPDAMLEIASPTWPLQAVAKTSVISTAAKGARLFMAIDLTLPPGAAL